MPSLLQIIIESIAYQAVFYGFYFVARRENNTFIFRRLYLLTTPVIAILLPLVMISFSPEPPKTVNLSRLNLETWLVNRLPDLEITVSDILKTAYLLGFAVFSFRLTDRLWEVRRLFLDKYHQPFSLHAWQGSPVACFSHFFWYGKSMNEERRHAWALRWLPLPYWSTLEVVWMEAITAVFWFNPLVHLFKYQLREVHRGTDFPERGPQCFSFYRGFYALCFFVALAVMAGKPELPSARAGKCLEAWCDHVLLTYEKPGTHTYRIEWGSISLLLEKFANPNGFAGEIEVELTDFQQILSKEFKVFRDEKRVKTGILSVVYESPGTGERAYINDIDPGKIVLKDRRSGKIYNDSLLQGDELMLFGEAEDIYLSKILVRIKDPDAAYIPPVKVPAFNYLEPKFGWQIVARAGKRTLVKIDPTQTGIEKIAGLYTDAGRYEIVNIPGFRTNRRYLGENDALFREGSIAEVSIAHALPDPLYLLEFQGYQNQETILVWGEMTANPSSENYSLEQFAGSFAQPLKLEVGGKTLPIQSFEVIIANKKDIPTGYLTDNVRHSVLQEAFSRLQPETSIYFDRIIVKDGGIDMLFPAAFGFHLGNKTMPIPGKKTEHNSPILIHFGEKTTVAQPFSVQPSKD
jgi:hypothetical protein